MSRSKKPRKAAKQAEKERALRDLRNQRRDAVKNVSSDKRLKRDARAA